MTNNQKVVKDCGDGQAFDRYPRSPFALYSSQSSVSFNDWGVFVKAKIAGITVSLIVTAMGAFVPALSYAQDTGSTAPDATQPAPATSAQKKAARKQAHAQKNAELKKLEDAG